jgi:hypothetical protein
MFNSKYQMNVVSPDFIAFGKTMQRYEIRTEAPINIPEGHLFLFTPSISDKIDVYGNYYYSGNLIIIIIRKKPGYENCNLIIEKGHILGTISLLKLEPIKLENDDDNQNKNDTEVQ